MDRENVIISSSNHYIEIKFDTDYLIWQVVLEIACHIRKDTLSMSNNTNIEFFDEYKRLDKLCSEMYGKSSGGVTSYINDMELVPAFQAHAIPEWYSTYDRLKALRHIRNQMAHGEGSFDDYQCSYEDIEWLRAFRNRIMNVSDPLALYRRNIKNRTQLQHKQQSKQPEWTGTVENRNSYSSSDNMPPSLMPGVIIVISVAIIVYFFFH